MISLHDHSQRRRQALAHAAQTLQPAAPPVLPHPLAAQAPPKPCLGHILYHSPGAKPAPTPCAPACGRAAGPPPRRRAATAAGPAPPCVIHEQGRGRGAVRVTACGAKPARALLLSQLPCWPARALNLGGSEQGSAEYNASAASIPVWTAASCHSPRQVPPSCTQRTISPPAHTRLQNAWLQRAAVPRACCPAGPYAQCHST